MATDLQPGGGFLDMPQGPLLVSCISSLVCFDLSSTPWLRSTPLRATRFFATQILADYQPPYFFPIYNPSSLFFFHPSSFSFILQKLVFATMPLSSILHINRAIEQVLDGQSIRSAAENNQLHRCYLTRRMLGHPTREEANEAM